MAAYQTELTRLKTTDPQKIPKRPMTLKLRMARQIFASASPEMKQHIESLIVEEKVAKEAAQSAQSTSTPTTPLDYIA